MGKIELPNPLLVARSGKSFVIIGSDGLSDPMTDAQLWSQDRGYSDVQALGVHLKWLHYVEEVIPLQPWVEPK